MEGDRHDRRAARGRAADLVPGAADRHRRIASARVGGRADRRHRGAALGRAGDRGRPALDGAARQHAAHQQPRGERGTRLDGRDAGLRGGRAHPRALRGRLRRAAVGRDPQEGRQGLHQPASLVHHHRPARRGKDDRPAELRPRVPARRAARPGGDPGRRRHAQLRLVVHRRGRPHRYGRPLLDAGRRHRGRPGGVEGLPRSPQAPSPAAADQRRAAGHQPVGRPALARDGAQAACGRAEEAAAGTDARLRRAGAGLRAADQGRPDRRLQRVFRDAGRGRARAGLGHDAAARRQRGAPRRGVHRALRRARRPAARRRLRADARGARHLAALQDLHLPAGVREPATGRRRLHQRHLPAEPLRDAADPARHLLHQRHPGRRADPSPAQRHEPDLRLRGGQPRALCGARQGLLHQEAPDRHRLRGAGARRRQPHARAAGRGVSRRGLRRDGGARHRARRPVARRAGAWRGSGVGDGRRLGGGRAGAHRVPAAAYAHHRAAGGRGERPGPRHQQRVLAVVVAGILRGLGLLAPGARGRGAARPHADHRPPA